MMRNYLQRNIDIRSQLKKYRTDMNERFPDPVKKDPEESQSPDKKGAKGAPPAKAADKKGGSKDVTKEVTKEPTSEENVKEASPENSLMDIDSVIDDTEVPDFTEEFKYMRGADLDPAITSKMEEPPEKAKYLSNQSAMKTGFQTNYKFRDFESKKQDLMRILAEHKQA